MRHAHPPDPAIHIGQLSREEQGGLGPAGGLWGSGNTQGLGKSDQDSRAGLTAEGLPPFLGPFGFPGLSFSLYLYLGDCLLVFLLSPPHRFPVSHFPSKFLLLVFCVSFFFFLFLCLCRVLLTSGAISP